jgi:arsenical pump membrane protein
MIIDVTDPTQSDQAPSHSTSRTAVAWFVGGVGIIAAVMAVATRTSDAKSAATQDWPPFVLVAGLLLIGLVADDDHLFAAAGERLARVARSGVALFLGASLLIGVVTAILNLDTSVAFLTPVFVYAARSRGEREAPLLYACILLSNAGSLFLPGSNLTNLIVLGRLHVTGGQFFAHMWLPALAGLVVTAALIAFFERRSLHFGTERSVAPLDAPVFGVGLASIVIATVLVLVLRSPALPVFIVGAAAVGLRHFKDKEQFGRVLDVLGLPVLMGLFGLAVGLGTLGRVWSGPATLLSHLDAWGTAAMAAMSSVVVNNLPAASLLSSRTPTHPYALLIGLNLGPNLFVSGSLAWILWLRSARRAGSTPSIAGATRIGLVAVPLSIAAAVGLLLLTGSH